MGIDSIVRNWETKYSQGFMWVEITALLASLPEKGIEIKESRFTDAMMGNTCAVIDGMQVIYPHDIIKALNCAIEDRDLYFHEWD